jgi:hypothetical protein
VKRAILCVVALATLFASGLRAQDLSGNWQGTLKTPNKDLRIILNFSKGDKDGWNAKMYSIDQGGQPINASSVAKQGTAIKIAVDMIGGTYEGKISDDGNSISGTWTHGPTPMALILVKATPETAWEIPAPPPPPKLMAATQIRPLMWQRSSRMPRVERASSNSPSTTAISLSVAVRWGT